MANNLPSNIPAVKTLLEKNQVALQEALPKHIPVAKLIRVMVTQMSVNPALQKCTQVSLIGSLLKCCLYGLEPDGRDGALVPFGNVATFIPMYQGELKIARRTGEVSLIYAEVVRENDEFHMTKGLNPDLQHTPSLKDAGETIGAYAVIKLKSGESDFVWMTKADVEKVRNSSKAKNSGPWTQWWDEMAKKTVLKRMLKQAPKASEVQKEFDEADVNVFRAMDVLNLPTPQEEAQASIEAPKRVSEATPDDGARNTDGTPYEGVSGGPATQEKVDTETGEVTQGQPAQNNDVPFPTNE